jgi:hypothetical protein
MTVLQLLELYKQLNKDQSLLVEILESGKILISPKESLAQSTVDAIEEFKNLAAQYHQEITVWLPYVYPVEHPDYPTPEYHQATIPPGRR